MLNERRGIKIRVHGDIYVDTYTQVAIHILFKKDSCDGYFYMSIWLGYGMPRYILKHYFQVWVWVFLEEMRIWIGGWSEADETPQCGWPSSSPLWKKPDFYSLKVELCALALRLSDSRLESILSTPWLSGLSTISLALLGTQLADCTSWDFPAPQLCEPVPYNKSLYINTHTYTQVHTLT